MRMLTKANPLKVRVDIRDQWDSPNGLIQKSVDSLAKMLGHKVVPYVALKDTYPDKSTFVPSVIRAVVLFYDLLVARLEREGESEWTENILKDMGKSPAGWLLRIEAYNSSRPRVALKANLGQFLLVFPTHELAINAPIQAGFDQDLNRFFAPVASVAEIYLQWKGWDCPTELFKNTTPYIVRVDARTSPLIVEASHQPSLDLLVSYLKKWAKQNRQDSLKESDFVFGIIDRIEIELQFGNLSTRPLNPAIILAFVEGVLGYKETHTTGSIWTFKLETPLK
ncbi:hypothetical protein CPB84DRAFT_1826061 [Gymnopilus junonius]|uniref:Uncharacterized protein n=1 Tax=Gymnopilus junonius TaxID=109634 RepID=A0A9P5NJS9_GYMJU|nr:hypothetical protein CPB84DRAFT_1826061 [Gymnopilus junonius]